jgi:hypothetical protein
MRVKMKKTSASSAGVFLNNHEYEIENEFAESLVAVGAAVSLEPAPVTVETEPDPGPELVNVGGGYYELPDGERVKGKEKAEKALTDYLEEQEEKPAVDAADQKGDE